jgi:hypothetical protein
MSTASEFLKYCTRFLETDLKKKSNIVLNQVISKKILNENSNIRDIEEFISLLELSIIAVSGKKKADTICRSLREKAMEIDLISGSMEIRNSICVKPEELNVNDFMARLSTGNVGKAVKDIQIDQKQKLPVLPINADIDQFVAKNSLPCESEITRISADLALKYSCDPENTKKDIIEQINDNFRIEINKKVIKIEIDKFLFGFRNPAKEDLDDFVNYIKLLNLKFQDDELREQIETERLYRKFQDPILEITGSEIDRFISLLKAYTDKNDFIRALNENELSYLVKDEKGISEKLLFDLVELMVLIERDSPSGIYLDQILGKTPQ